VPLSTLIPLTMSWFGTGEIQKIAFLAMAFFVFLLPQALKAVDHVPDVYLRTAQTLGAGRHHQVFRVLVPVAAPDLWHALRLAFGVGWTYIVLTEALVMTDGLGYLITIAQRRGPREQIYLVIIIITVIAWLVDLGWDRLGRVLFPWRRAERT
jgi:ABC-type nitrate/sulfonate/bicarbonate transport system permease component